MCEWLRAQGVQASYVRTTLPHSPAAGLAAGCFPAAQQLSARPHPLCMPQLCPGYRHPLLAPGVQDAGKIWCLLELDQQPLYPQSAWWLSSIAWQQPPPTQLAVCRPTCAGRPHSARPPWLLGVWGQRLQRLQRWVFGVSTSCWCGCHWGFLQGGQQTQLRFVPTASCALPPLSCTAGHGTHTAATVGGLTYGVAKNVTLWAVRAMNCDGDAKVSSILEVCACLWEGHAALWHTELLGGGRPAAHATSWLLPPKGGCCVQVVAAAPPIPQCHALTQAFEWIAENAQQPAIMSMSVAGEMSVTVNEAARRLVEDRHIVMVGAGSDCCCLGDMWPCAPCISAQRHGALRYVVGSQNVGGAPAGASLRVAGGGCGQ